MSLAVEIEFRLNGVVRRATVPADMSALVMLRDVLGLTGTKYGCGEVDGASINSCLLFAVDCDGREVTTIEGLAGDERAERLQRAFTAHGAVQCGFCTPGMVIQATRILAQHPHPDRAMIQRGLEGNLCRCTGYRKIIDAVAAAADQS
jgi:aerobic carbon-monoxide dehydrogenase small subunit